MLTAEIYLGQQILLNLLRKEVLQALESMVYSATQYLKKKKVIRLIQSFIHY